EALRHDAVASGQRPDSAWILINVAQDYAGLGSYDRAIVAYRKGISLSPSIFAGLANLWMGEALLKKEDWEAAIAAFREAIRLLSERRMTFYLPNAYANLGAALFATGRPAEADDVSREALRLKLTPDEPSWLRYLGESLATAGRPAEALRRMRAALGRNPAWAEDP